jgi:hypothetical protein
METVPAYVSVTFILTTFTAVAFLLRATRVAGLETFPAKILIFLLPLWIFFQAALSILGFYEDFNSVPPRLILTGVLPASFLVLVYLTFFRRSFVDRIPLKLLTLLHIVRIPVELVLMCLSFAGQVPQMMTFYGINYDIIAGVAAPLVAVVGFRGLTERRGVLIIFNCISLLLLLTIISIAALSLPSVFQQLNFDQPNRAVQFFPYVFLPTIIVPIVLFAHLAALLRLIWPIDRSIET